MAWACLCVNENAFLLLELKFPSSYPSLSFTQCNTPIQVIGIRLRFL